MRIKRGKTVHKKHKKILFKVKGYRGGRSKIIKQAKEALLHAGQYAYTGRKLKKRDFRRLWIIRLSAALEKYNISYSRFIASLKKEKIELDRKILAQIALEDPETFDQIVRKVTS